MFSRNLDLARKAYYETGSVEMSKAAHRPVPTTQNEETDSLPYGLSRLSSSQSSHNEKHNNSGAYIKSGVYGGLDGIITTYSVVMGVAGANLSTIVVLALGIANLVGDGICMALGDYISTKSEIQFQQKERMREEWEVENNPDEEKQEMIELYEQKGISKEDATSAVEIISKNKKAWVDIMMVEELGLLPTDENPIKNALVTFIAFLSFGLVPLIPFIVIQIASIESGNELFYISTGLAAIFLFILGFTKSLFTYSKWWKSGLETLIIGIIAAGSSYLIGLAFRPLTNGNDS